MIAPLSTPAAHELVRKVNEIVSVVNDSGGGGGGEAGRIQLFSPNLDELIEPNSYVIHGMPDGNLPDGFIDLFDGQDISLNFDVSFMLFLEGEGSEEDSFSSKIVTQRMEVVDAEDLSPSYYQRTLLVEEYYFGVSEQREQEMLNDYGYIQIGDGIYAQFLDWRLIVPANLSEYHVKYLMSNDSYLTGADVMGTSEESLFAIVGFMDNDLGDVDIDKVVFINSMGVQADLNSLSSIMQVYGYGAFIPGFQVTQDDVTGDTGYILGFITFPDLTAKEAFFEDYVADFEKVCVKYHKNIVIHDGG